MKQLRCFSKFHFFFNDMNDLFAESDHCFHILEDNVSSILCNSNSETSADKTLF